MTVLNTDQPKSEMNGSTVKMAEMAKAAEAAEGEDEAKKKQEEAEAEDDDPWTKLPGFANSGPAWSEISTMQKVGRVIVVILKIFAICLLLYFFICSIDLLGSAFQVLGGRSAGALFTQDSLLANPIAGLMIGVLTTVLMQSSSTTTSIITAMVASNIISVEIAIPMIMGCNIGTTVTNTIVSLGQLGDREQFRRAFAGATVHDVFNWTVVCILLPFEVWTGYLFHLTTWIVSNMNIYADPGSIKGLSVITDPFTELIIQVDKSVITAIAEGNQDIIKRPLPLYWADEVTANFSQAYPLGQVNQTHVDSLHAEVFTQNIHEVNVTDVANTSYTDLRWIDALYTESTEALHIFQGTGMPDSSLGETGVGLILLVMSLATLLISLILLVKVLSSLLQGTALKAVNRALNAELPGYLSWATGYLAMIIGVLFTVVLQSSSVFTSILTPLVGIGVLTVERMYPLTLGANIGTTATSVIAAFSGDNVLEALQIAFCHLFFNITGVLMFYPIPFTRKWAPFMAKKLGNITADHRWFAFVYIVLMFLVLPLSVLALSVGGWQVLYGVGLPILMVIVVIVITNMLQDSAPSLLPAYLRDWSFLPIYLRSLDPYDKVFVKCQKKGDADDATTSAGDKASVSSDQGSSGSIKKLPPSDPDTDLQTKMNTSNGYFSNTAYSTDEPNDTEGTYM